MEAPGGEQRLGVELLDLRQSESTDASHGCSLRRHLRSELAAELLLLVLEDGERQRIALLRELLQMERW